MNEKSGVTSLLFGISHWLILSLDLVIALKSAEVRITHVVKRTRLTSSSVAVVVVWWW